MYNRYSGPCGSNDFLIESGSGLVRFNEEDHTYELKLSPDDSWVGTPSVNHILNQVFGNSYANVDPEVLAAAQNKGKEIHNEIKEFLVNGVLGCTPEFESVKKEIIETSRGTCMCEQYVYATTQYGNYCGTFDTYWPSNALLVDYKTSSSLNKAHIKRQLNMYSYALKQIAGYSLENLEAWHLSKGKLKRVKFKLEPPQYVENIVRAYYEGNTFKTDQEMMDYYKYGTPDEPGVYSEFLDNCKKIKELDNVLDKLKIARERVAEQIKTYLENNKLDSFKDDSISVDYCPQTTRETFNSAKLKEEQPEVYKSFIKESVVKSHIRVSYPKEKNK